MISQQIRKWIRDAIIIAGQMLIAVPDDIDKPVPLLVVTAWKSDRINLSIDG